MDTKRHDCTWCGSAASIEYGVCQVCLMEFPNEATIVKLTRDKVLKIRDERPAIVNE